MLVSMLASCGESYEFDGVEDISGLHRVEGGTFLGDLPSFEDGYTAPYVLCYGTTEGTEHYSGNQDAEKICCVSNTCVNPDYDGDIHIVIPEKNENGGTVRAFASIDTYVYYFPFNIPREDFDIGTDRQQLSYIEG